MTRSELLERLPKVEDNLARGDDSYPISMATLGALIREFRLSLSESEELRLGITRMMDSWMECREECRRLKVDNERMKNELSNPPYERRG